MIVLKGKAASSGIAVGTIKFASERRPRVEKRAAECVDHEKRRFKLAKADASNQLQYLYEKAYHKVGEADAKIFSIHQMLLEDKDFADEVYDIIDTEMVCAEYAVEQVANSFYDMFSQMEDEYMSSRCTDVKDVADRVLRILCNKDRSKAHREKDLIICADDLSPSETVQMNRDSVTAFISRKGSSHSHTAILARRMSIPAVVGAGDKLLSAYNGCKAVVNAFTGEIFIVMDGLHKGAPVAALV